MNDIYPSCTFGQTNPKESRKCPIFVDKDNGRQILSTKSIVNLKNIKLIAIEHACEHHQSITCMNKLADAQKKTSTILIFNLLRHESLKRNGKC